MLVSLFKDYNLGCFHSNMCCLLACLLIHHLLKRKACDYPILHHRLELDVFGDIKKHFLVLCILLQLQFRDVKYIIIGNALRWL